MTSEPAKGSVDPSNVIAFQGIAGAYSDMACRTVYPEMTTLPCELFEDAFAAVRDGRARLAMIPIENSVAGRVADIHSLLPESGLHIIGEHFQRINHYLLAPKDTRIEGVKVVLSHVHALNQCRRLINEFGLQTSVHADTAGAAQEVATRNDPTVACIASKLAADTYGLEIMRTNIEDAEHNTTRFIMMAREAINPNPDAGPVITTFVFRVRNVPAALFKAMGGFATNGVNMTKLESYMLGGRFSATEFYADVEGHPERRNLRLAFEELEFFSREVRVLGVYPAHAYRYQVEALVDD